METEKTAAPAVFEEEVAEKSPSAVQPGGKRPATFAHCAGVVGPELRVSFDSPALVLPVFISVVMDFAVEFLGGPFQFKSFMDRPAGKFSAPFSEQTHEEIGIPVAETNFFPLKNHHAGDEKAVFGGKSHFQFRQLILKLRREIFIGIQQEYPVVIGLLDGEVFLSDEAFPFVWDDFGAEIAGDPACGVRAAAVHDDNFIRHRLEAFQTAGEVFFLIQSDDTSGDFHFLTSRMMFPLISCSVKDTEL